MFEEDAATQMEELGHQFFVFVNAESERVCILYRRNDGDLGLIEPIIGDVLAALRSLAGCRLARMSGSGATCFGIFDSSRALPSAVLCTK